MRYCALLSPILNLIQYGYNSLIKSIKLKSLNCNQPQLSIIGACLCTSSAGIIYAFSLYGPQLGMKLEFSSVQINMVSVAGSLGVYICTPLYGYGVDTIQPSRIGLLSSLMFFLGFTAMSLTYAGVLSYSSYWALGFYYFVVGNACAAANIAALSTSGHNFQKQRGIGIGVPVTFFGLSAFIFSSIYHLFFVKQGVPNTKGFLQFLAWATALSTFIGSFLLVKTKYQPIELELDAIQFETSLELGQEDQTEKALFLDIGVKELFYNTDARFLYVIILLLGGTGLMYINNVGTVLRTLQIDQPKRVPALQSYNVSTLSLFNCLGRLVFAVSSDYVASFNIRRLTYLLFAALIICVSQFFVTFAPVSWVVVCSAALGFGYGLMFAVMTTITSLWFGTRNYGSNWGLISTGPGIGGQIMSLFFGFMYDSNSTIVNPDKGGSKVCRLGSCYASAFYLGSVLSLIAAIVIISLKNRRELLYI